MTPVPALLCLLLALPARAASLEERVIARLVIDDRGVPAEGVELRAALRRMLKSPTARALAPGLLAKKGAITVHFVDSLGGRSEAFDGERWLDGTNATTEREGRSQSVNVDARLRDPKLGGYEGILAHELFGHAVPWLSIRGGPLEKFYGFSAEEELRAELIGGVVAAELGRKSGGLPLELALSTAAVSELFAWEYTPKSLLLEDLPRARRVYVQRAERAAREEAHSRLRLKQFGVWRYRIDHLVNAHGYDRRRFSDAWESLAFHSRSHGSCRKRWDQIRADERAMIGTLDSRGDRDWIPGLAKLGRETIVAEQRRDTERLRVKLRRLLKKNPKLLEPSEPEPSPALAQFGWQDIERLVSGDRARHPEHYAGEPPLDAVEVSQR